MLTTSPATIDSPNAGRAPSETTASPVLTAMRICRSPPASSSTMSRTTSAARTARSASSPWATGAPKTPITASPMNFSTTPPNDSISRRTRSWYGASTARTSSGSSRSALAVNPTRSTKMTVTIRRSSLGSGIASPIEEPQARQKRATSGFSWPQAGQTTIGRSLRPPATKVAPAAPNQVRCCLTSCSGRQAMSTWKRASSRSVARSSSPVASSLYFGQAARDSPSDSSASSGCPSRFSRQAML